MANEDVIRIACASWDGDNLAIVTHDSLGILTRKLAMMDSSAAAEIPVLIMAAFEDGAAEVIVTPAGQVTYTKGDSVYRDDTSHPSHWRHALERARETITKVLGLDEQPRTTEGAPVEAFTPPF